MEQSAYTTSYLHKCLAFEQHSISVSVKLPVLLLAWSFSTAEETIHCFIITHTFILYEAPARCVDLFSRCSDCSSPIGDSGFQGAQWSPGTRSSAHSYPLLFLENATHFPRLELLFKLFPLTACLPELQSLGKSESSLKIQFETPLLYKTFPDGLSSVSIDCFSLPCLSFRGLTVPWIIFS